MSSKRYTNSHKMKGIGMGNDQAIQSQQPESKAWPKVAIIILNWNGWRDTIECLESLQRIDYPNYQIIVVDNGSTDDSVERIKAWVETGNAVRTPPSWFHRPTSGSSGRHARTSSAKPGDSKEHLQICLETKRFVLICSRENLGFAAGCNVGIRRAISANCQYVLLLNNDMVVAPGFLSAMVNRAQQYWDVGVVGPKIYYADAPQILWYAGGKLTLLKPGGIPFGRGKQDVGQYNEIRQVTFVTGAAMLVKREVFSTVGLLDERFFFGMEDYDFCRRVARKGYRLLYVPDAVVWHKVGASRSSGPLDVYRGYKASSIYMKKHLPWWAWCIWFCLYALYALILAPYRDYAGAAKIPRLAFRKAVLRALWEGIFHTQVSRDDTENVRRKGVARRR